ncbi:hypothetical protein D9M71_426680 [compost metagenome]
MPVHLLADQVMGQLVHRSGGKAPAGFEQAEEVVAVGHQPIVVDTRIALVDGDRAVAVSRLDLRQALGDQGEGFIPLDGQPFATGAAHGLANAVWVVLDVLQSHRLGADVAATETVLGVALDGKDAAAAVVLVFGLDGQAADGLAEMACTVMDGLGHCLASCSCSRRPVRSRMQDYGARTATRPAASAP